MWRISCLTLGGISCYQTCCLFREIALFIGQFISTFNTMNEEKNMKNYFSLSLIASKSRNAKEYFSFLREGGGEPPTPLIPLHYSERFTLAISTSVDKAELRRKPKKPEKSDLSIFCWEHIIGNVQVCMSWFPPSPARKVLVRSH